MAFYLGFFRPNDHYVRYLTEKILSEELKMPPPGQPGGADPRMGAKVRGFPAFLQERGVRLVASYDPVGFPFSGPVDPPGVTIIETDDDANLRAINQYYAPFLTFQFHRYNPVER